MTGELLANCRKYAGHLAGLCEAALFLVDLKGPALIDCEGDEALTCHRCGCAACNPLRTHLYGANEAYRWNGRYIYYCPVGFIFVASSLSDDQGQLTGAMVAGPVVMGEAEDFILPSELRDTGLNPSSLPNLSPAVVNHLSEVMAAVTSYLSGMPHSRTGLVLYDQEQLLNSLYATRMQNNFQSESYAYPIQTEKRLQEMILNKDKSGSQLLLNELLGHIYFSADFDLETIRARVLELAVLISRATIDAGADLNEIFLFSTNCIKEIERITSIEDLSVWITGVMHRFISYSFDFTGVKHSDVVFKVMEYVKNNFSKKITLDDVARHVFLSKSYLSRIFKDETGISLSHYINKVRIEKSKLMLTDHSTSLVDVASLVGFEDQSYFTKVFKKMVGVSPKAYRENRNLRRPDGTGGT